MIKVNRGQLLVGLSDISMGLGLSPGPSCGSEMTLGPVGELVC
jgi:hypothetical protein